MTSPFVSVIVPTFRRFEPLIQTVRDLLDQAYPNFEIVVADQNPEWPPELGRSLDAIKADPRVHWLTLESPGVVYARNAAVAESTGSLLLFVDDDVSIPSPFLIRNHVSRFDDAGTSAVAGRERQVGDVLTEPSASDAPQGEPQPGPAGLSPLQEALSFDRNSTVAREVCTFSTCNGSMRRSAFLSVGGFDELFAGNSYGDDYDLALRLHAEHHRIMYEPSAWLVHRRCPLGGLRLSDPANRSDARATAQGMWLFVLRHGHRGVYGYLLLHHVLRKTVLLKRNLLRPWREPWVLLQTILALPVAYAKLSAGPQSIFQPAGEAKTAGEDSRTAARARVQ